MTINHPKHQEINHSKQYAFNNPALKRPTASTIVFLCMTVANLIYVLLYLPTGIQSILAYPLNLVVLALVNISVYGICWLGGWRHGRAILHGFFLALLLGVVIGNLVPMVDMLLRQNPWNISPVVSTVSMGSAERQLQRIAPTANPTVSSHSARAASTKINVPGLNGWYTSPVQVYKFREFGSSVVPNGYVTVSSEGIHEVPVGPGAKQIIRIDQTGPQTEWVDPAPGSIVSGVMDVHTMSTDEVSYPAVVEVSLDNGKTWQSTEFPPKEMNWLKRTPEVGLSVNWDTTGLTAGSYTLLARSQDVAGNWGSTASLTLVVDPTKPVNPSQKYNSPSPKTNVFGVSSKNDDIVDAGRMNVAGQNGWYTSAVRAYKFRDVGASVVQDGYVTVSDEGIHKMPVGVGAYQMIRIDRTVPQTDWIDPAPDATVSGVVDVHTISIDTVSYPAVVEVSFDNGKTWQSAQFPPATMNWLERTPYAGWSVNWDSSRKCQI